MLGLSMVFMVVSFISYVSFLKTTGTNKKVSEESFIGFGLASGLCLVIHFLITTI